MTTAQVLERLGTSRPILQRLIDEGLIAPINRVPSDPYARRARRWLFNRADVERLAAARAATPAHLDAAPGRRLVEDGPGYDPHAA